MLSKFATALLVSAAISTSAFAQPVPAPEPALAAETAAPVAVAPPVVAPPVVAPTEAQLPAGTDVLLRLNDQLTSRNHRMGDTFPLTVVQDVSVNGHVVIPAGTRAIGQVTWRTGRGGFGKSGKIEITLRYLDLNGQRIPITGFFRQEGEGNTAATVGAVVAAGLVGGLIVRGRTAVIPQGREFTARTVDAIPVMLAADSTAATIAASYTPSRIPTALGRREDQRPQGQRRSR